MTVKNNTPIYDGTLFRMVISCFITVGGFFSLALGHHFFYNHEDNLVNNILEYMVPFIYLFLVYGLAKKTKLIHNRVFEKRHIRLKTIKTILLGALFFLVAILVSMLENVMPFLDQPPRQDFFPILFQLIIYSLCIGFFEEGLFRGVMLNLLVNDRSKKALWLGFMFSSFLFGMIHLGNLTVEIHRPLAIMTQIIYAMMVGMTLAALYVWFQSFLGIALLHGAIDFIAYYPQLYGQKAVVASEHAADIRVLDAAATIGVLIPSAVLAILLLQVYSQKMLRLDQDQNTASDLTEA